MIPTSPHFNCFLVENERGKKWKGKEKVGGEFI